MQIFSQAQANLARYWYEKALFTHGPVALPTGPSTIFTASNWTNPQQPEWMAELVGLWASQSSGVQLSWIADDRTFNRSASQGFTDAFPGSVSRVAVNAPAVRQLVLIANNLTGAPVADFQLNYEVAMRRLTVADKLLMGYGLSQPDEKAMALLGKDGVKQVRDLVERGSAPLPLESQLERVLENRNLGEHAMSGTYHVTASAAVAGTPFATIMAGAGEFLVLREIAVEGGAALGSTMTLMMDRDEDASYLQLTGNAFAHADPWPVFVPAMRSLSFRASAVAPLANVPVRIRVDRYKLSNLLRVRFGLANSPEAVPGDTYAKVKAGIA